MMSLLHELMVSPKAASLFSMLVSVISSVLPNNYGNCTTSVNGMIVRESTHIQCDMAPSMSNKYRSSVITSLIVHESA